MAGELIGATQRQRGRGPDDRRHIGEQILSRRNKGEKMYVIVADLGISEDSAYRYMKLALDARLVPTVDEFRRQQNDALDEMEAEIERNLATAEQLIAYHMAQESAAGVERGIALRNQTLTLRRNVMERRAKLNGLDAPVVVSATVTHLDSRDIELEEIANEARAKAAAARERAGRGA